MERQLPTQKKEMPNPVEAMFAAMNRKERRAFVIEHRRQREKLPTTMQVQALPEDMKERVLGAWKSRDYSAIAWRCEYPGIICRLSVNRLDVDETTGSFLGGISWDQLWRIKNECGYELRDAIEIFPAIDKLINVANMRHLWVFEKRIAFGLTP